jgi:hypothetical protein
LKDNNQGTKKKEMHTMRTLHIIISLGVGLVALTGLPSCSTTGGPSAAAPGAAPVGSQVVLNKPMAAAHQAALHALSTIGAEVKKNEPTYVEGRRPNKMGLFVGSGGETVKVWLTAQEGEKTGVTVKTEKSFVGIAGQKNWDADVIAAMR